MLGNRAVADATSLVVVLTFLTRVSSLLLERPVLPSVVSSHSINFYSFIFHCSAVSGSYSTLTPLDNVRLTARREPKLRADHLLF